MTPSKSAFLPFPGPARKGSRLPWYVAVIGCIYYAWLGIAFQRAIPIFSKLFIGLGVDLPLPTRILFSTYAWFIPVLFLGAVILTIANQTAIFNDSQRRIANLFLLFTGVVFPALIVLALYSPMFVLIYRLHSAK